MYSKEMSKILKEWRKYNSTILNNDKINDLIIERNNPYGFKSKLEVDFLPLGVRLSPDDVESLYNNIKNNKKILDQIEKLGYTINDFKLKDAVDFKMFSGQGVFSGNKTLVFPKNKDLVELICNLHYLDNKENYSEDSGWLKEFFMRINWKDKNPIIASSMPGDLSNRSNSRKTNPGKMIWAVHDLVHHIESSKEDSAYKVFAKKYMNDLDKRENDIRKLIPERFKTYFNLEAFIGFTGFIQEMTPGVGFEDTLASVVAAMFFIDKSDIPNVSLEYNKYLSLLTAYDELDPGVSNAIESVIDEIKSHVIDFFTYIYDFAHEFVNSMLSIEEAKNLCIIISDNV